MHDAHTKGRKSPTHLITDAWIKGIKELTVIYYNYVGADVVSELTEAAEIMEMLGGQMDVLLPGSKDWKTFKAGESYQVPANSKFKLKVPVVADYCCSYLK